MAKKNALRKQVAALEKLAGLVEVSDARAAKINGGRHKKHKTKTSNSVTLALGSGAVEAVCNPLIATIYPDKKTQKLSQFHMWFPGGIVIGGVLCYALSAAGIDSWRLKIGLSIVPAIGQRV